MAVKHVYWVLWALMALILEACALVNGVPNDTLTGTIATHLPAWLTFAGIGWLGWHFTSSYLNGNDER